MPTRIQQYSEVSTALALHSDRRLAEVVDGATVLGAGIGGTSKRLDVDGGPVFVKRVPLTDRELRPEHVASTANVCVASVRPVRSTGEVQGENPASSTLHWNEEPPTVEVNLNVAEVEPTKLPSVGPAVIVVFGMGDWTVQSSSAGVGSVFPTWSVARTRKVWPPPSRLL